MTLARSTEPRDRASRWLLAIALVTCTLACIAGVSDVDVGVQEWWEGRGPVVPHDSFPGDCSLCHEGDDWHTIADDFAFDHLAETGVELVGAHGEAQCLRCHNDRGPVELFARQGCAGCHEDVHRGKLGTNCVDCHAETSWEPEEQIALHARTRFPLQGAHAAVACWRCHPGADGGNFAPVDVACATCHAQDLARAALDHSGFSTSCEDCHAATTWGTAGFVHSTYPLLGAHAATDCAECHVGGVFSGTPESCDGCHADDYAAATQPNHLAAGFSTDCEACHRPNDWNRAQFEHDAWALTGSHVVPTCNQCHVGDVFDGLPDQCVDCHLAEYQGTTNPDHVAGAYSTDCEQCHTTLLWEPANFDHSSFTLAGGHGGLDCTACHAGGVFGGTPTDCFACHMDDYQDADDPPHASAGFPTDCEQCHTIAGWEPADFDHSSFALVGGHAGQDCADCHAGGVYVGTPSECSACHQQEFDATTDPPHGAAGFPTTCDACHTVTTWLGATFDHQFPIQSGDHGGLSCTDCHMTPRNYAVFTCTACHEHNESDMADEHDEDDISGYVWESSACYTCHPNGQGD